MVEHDFDAFAALMDDAATLLGKPMLSDRQMGLYFAALAEHSLPAVRSATLAHMRDPQRGRFMPTPADVIAQLQGMAGDDGRPGAEEAWALALRSQDEAATIVWTAEMAEAWGIARAVLPDEVGARMAFKEAYARLCQQARQQGVRPAWSASLGHDPAQRDEALTAAVHAGLLPASHLPALPAPAVPLLALEYAPGAPDHARAALRRLRERLAERQDADSADVIERARTEELKAQTAARVAAAQAAQGRAA